jgi:triacylglycerol esterase/lipase EstA (alpha/beta hydrolase family)
MLARLQAVMAVVLLGLVAVGVAGVLNGRTALGLLVLAAVLCGHAVVLALEFALVAWQHQNDPAPRATGLELLQAWWQEVLVAPQVFVWRQPFRSRAWPDFCPATRAALVDTSGPGQLPQAQPRRGVLLVHGYVCNRGLWNPWLQRLRAAGVPHVAVNLEPVFGSIDDTLPVLEAAVQRLHAATGCAPLVVCHSMGGLALRAWWALPGNRHRIAQVFTLGTPHQGTWLARWGFSRNARQMRQGSAWLQHLATLEQDGRCADVTCFYSHADNIVFPASTATLKGAEHRHLPACAHVHMAHHPAPWQAVAESLGLPVR